jgi:hypothetical protein
MASFFSGGDEARDQALELAGRTTLPLTARSLTEAEIARVDGRVVPVLLGLYLVPALPLLLIAAFSGLGAGALALTAAFAALLAGLLWVVAHRRARARNFYRDPQAVLEIGTDAMTLRTPGHVDKLAYADTRFAVESVRLRGATYFLGLVLETPRGPLRLEDLWCKPGRTAAAAVVGRVEGVRIRGE